MTFDGKTHGEGGMSLLSRHAISRLASLSAIGTEYTRTPFATVNLMIFLSKSISCQRSASMLPRRAPVNSAVIHHILLIGPSVFTPRAIGFPSLSFAAELH